MRYVTLLGACGLLAACTTGPVTVPRDTVLYEVPRQPATAPRAAVPQAGRQAASLQRSPVPIGPAQMAGQQMAGGPIVAPQERGPEAFEDRIARVLDEPALPAQPGMVGLPAQPMVGLSRQPELAGLQGQGGMAPPPVAGLPAPVAGVPEGGGTPLDDDRLNLNEYTLEQQRIDAAIAERELEEARQQLVIVEPGASVPQGVEGVNIVLFAKQTTHAVGERRYARPVTAALNRGGACRRFASADEAQRFFLANGGPERDPHGLDPDGDGFACGWNPEPFRRLRL